MLCTVDIYIESIQICFSLLRLGLFRKLNDFWTHGINYKLNATHSLSLALSIALFNASLCCVASQFKFLVIHAEQTVLTTSTTTMVAAAATRKYIRAHYFLLFGVRCSVGIRERKANKESAVAKWVLSQGVSSWCLPDWFTLIIIITILPIIGIFHLVISFLEWKFSTA